MGLQARVVTFIQPTVTQQPYNGQDLAFASFQANECQSCPEAMGCCCFPWSHGLRPKKLQVSVAVLPASVRVPNQRPLAPSVALLTSVVNDKGDNEMILGTVHRSPGICLTAEENPIKPQLGDRRMKGLCNQSSPQMGSLSSICGR